MDYGSDIQGDQRVGKSGEGSPQRRGCCSGARLPLFSIDKPEQARRGGHGQRRVVFFKGPASEGTWSCPPAPLCMLEELAQGSVWENPAILCLLEA